MKDGRPLRGNLLSPSVEPTALSRRLRRFDQAQCWGLLWRSHNLLDGETVHIIRGGDCLPVLFHTRREARAHAIQRFGYIKERPDLRGEPHGWKMPVAIRLTVTASNIGESK